MRLYVGFKVFETIVDPADINRARATFGEKMQVIGPKLEASGVFAGKRQGFMVLNVASEDEAFSLLAELPISATSTPIRSRPSKHSASTSRRARCNPTVAGVCALESRIDPVRSRTP